MQTWITIDTGKHEVKIASPSRLIRTRPWPNNARAAVSLTFDVDADAGDCWRHLSGRLTLLSEAQYGIGAGLQRLVRLLHAHDIKATFYVPGEVADNYPDEVRKLFDDGHEIGHHGYFHLFTDTVRQVEEREELLRGIEALVRVTGDRPAGYRSPGWELTPVTLELLVQEGFGYDSSCMGDDNPYMLRDGSRQILELPIDWSLDDWVFFRFARDAGGIMSDPEALLRTWTREIMNAMEESRHVTLTMHPEVMGRGYRCHVLGEFIGWLKSQNIWIANHAQVVHFLTSAPPTPSAR